jgi:metal-responsive CopG/Arc/MetJ family transcriptional regulator
MSQVTFRIQDELLADVDKSLDPRISEKRSDFFRKAAEDRLKLLRNKVKRNE